MTTIKRNDETGEWTITVDDRLTLVTIANLLMFVQKHPALREDEVKFAEVLEMEIMEALRK